MAWDVPYATNSFWLLFNLAHLVQKFKMVSIENTETPRGSLLFFLFKNDLTFLIEKGSS